MILIGLGANLPSAAGPPAKTLAAALVALRKAGVRVRRRSRWYRSAPVPPSSQPDYVNGVVVVDTALGPTALLFLLHRIEARFGRVRGVANTARTLDLDLLAYGNRIEDGVHRVILPHPRLHRRAFVLRPLAEVAPRWRHPILLRTAAALAKDLPIGERVRPF